MPVSDADTAASPLPFRKLILLWLAWPMIVIGFQALVDWRYQPARLDRP
jgi:hypothetical protein